MDFVNDLHELCETLGNELSATNEKISNAGGKITGSDLEYVDKLTHAIKSIKTTLAMMEAEDGYSQRGSYDGNMYDGGSYRRGSYYGGRGSYANNRRDSRGRYSNRGYSMHGGDMVEELEQLMQEAPNETIRQEMSKLINKVQQMQ